MRINRVFTSFFGIAVVASLASWVAFEHQARLALEQEHQLLERRVAQMNDLTARNEQLLNQGSSPPSLPEDQSRELLGLRGEVGVLRRQLAELQTAGPGDCQALSAEANRGTNAVATADYWPRGAWAFSGYATPDAALQSSLWAANQGDLKALLASTTGDVQRMMASDFEGKSAAEASIKAMDEVSNLKSVRILSREPQGDDTAVLTAVFEDRGETHTEKLVLKRVGNDWKLASLQH